MVPVQVLIVCVKSFWAYRVQLMQETTIALNTLLNSGLPRLTLFSEIITVNGLYPGVTCNSVV